MLRSKGEAGPRGLESTAGRKPASQSLPGGRAGDGAAGVHQHAPAVARGRVTLHRLVEAAVGALRDDHVVVLGLPGLLQGRLLLLVTRGHCSEEETGVRARETGGAGPGVRGRPGRSLRCCGQQGGHLPQGI